MALFGRKSKSAKEEIQEQKDAELSDFALTTGVNEDGEIVDLYKARTNVKSDPDVGAMILDDMDGTSMRSVSQGVSTSKVATRSGRKGRSMDFAKLDAAIAEIAAEKSEDGVDDEDQVIDVSKLSKAKKKALQAAMADTIDFYPHLMALKPRESYVFHSDYFEVDDQYATIMSFFHNDSAVDTFGAFWGINRIPPDLGVGVTAVTLEQVARMPDKWVEERIRNSEKIDKLEDREQGDSGGRSSKRRAAKVADDMAWVTAEYQDGASYLNVHNRIMLRAPSLEALDEALVRLKQIYIDRFPSVTIAAYPGEQADEMSNLLAFNKAKHGKGFGYTSTEFAGSYSLVTNGLNDKTGEYVGDLYGDVNRSAILMDVNKYRKRVVVADDTVHPGVYDQRFSDMWASKISQAALLNGNRVVHLVLNNAKLDLLGPSSLSNITSKVDLTNGEVNMFEVFGDVEDELSLFAIHIRKIVLMAAQILKSDSTIDGSLAVVNGQLGQVLKKFYIDQGMWTANAKENRDRLRLVGIPHDEVPLLHVFQAYLDSAHATENSKEHPDRQFSEALGTLSMIFRSLLDAHNELFDQITDSRIDHVNDSRRVVYEFSGLSRRGPGIAMAQLINVVNFAVESLGNGDTVIIHGADSIVDEQVQEFLTQQFDRLMQRGGRVAYVYDSVESMLDMSHFNKFTKADYTVLGPMGIDTVNQYQEQMQQIIPQDLIRIITTKESGQNYLRRGASNVVFRMNLSLGINKRLYEEAQSAGRVKKPVSVVTGKQQSSTGAVSARDAHGGGGTALVSGDVAHGSSGALEVEQANREDRLSGTSRVEAHDKAVRGDDGFTPVPHGQGAVGGVDRPKGLNGGPDESNNAPKGLRRELGVPARTLGGESSGVRRTLTGSRK